MVAGRFCQRAKSRQFARSMTAALCLLVGFFAGCDHKDGVTVNVEKANISSSGDIALRIRIEKNAGAYKVSELLKTGATETSLGESVGIGQGGVTTFTNVFHTAEPSSVQFLVKQGESVFLPTGTENDLLQFTRSGVTARYTIRVREAATEWEKTVPADGNIEDSQGAATR